MLKTRKQGFHNLLGVLLYQQHLHRWKYDSSFLSLHPFSSGSLVLSVTLASFPQSAKHLPAFTAHHNFGSYFIGVAIWQKREAASLGICPGLNANEIEIPYDKHHKVSSWVKSHLNTQNSVKYEVIWKFQITLPNMKYLLNNTCVQSWA